MERESFEDEEVAAILNEGYIAIKVDREERPDIDHLYMNFCQAMTGHGGWPLTVIMTPDKKPFFAGTYFPKNAKMGISGLIDILQRVSEIWSEDPGVLLESGDDLVNTIIKNNMAARSGEISLQLIEKAYESFQESYDGEYGGFGSAPKFPTPHNLTFLLRYGQEEEKKKSGGGLAVFKMIEKTLEQMYKGGIFDHIGFGFSRYSTDSRWLVPHFEKMLYDNALLAVAYLEAFQVTKRPLYRQVAERIFKYVLRDMTSSQGGFYSAEDADSEGIEGKFYLWTPREVKEILGPEKSELFCAIYDINEKGNFEGKSIPNLIGISLDEKRFRENAILLEECRKELFEAREKWVHPFKDDKILTGWNALMIVALSMGGRILDNSVYLAAAEKAVNFIIDKMQRPDGRLLARYRDKEAAYPAYLDDYAFLVWALLEIYKATYRPYYLEKAIEFNSYMLDLFWDKEQGGLFMTGEDAEVLLSRTKEIYDGAVPSGNSVAAMNMLQLAGLTGQTSLEEKVEKLFMAFGGDIQIYPAGYSFLLQAYLYSQVTTKEIIIVDEKGINGAGAMLELLKKQFLPHTVSLFVSPYNSDIIKTVPFLQNYQSIDGKATAYVCEGKACREPLTSLDEFIEILGLNNT